MPYYTVVLCIIPLRGSVTLVVFHNLRFDSLHSSHVIVVMHALCIVVILCTISLMCSAHVHTHSSVIYTTVEVARIYVPQKVCVLLSANVIFHVCAHKYVC